MSWAGAYRMLMRGLEPFASVILARRVKSGKEDETRISERKGIASIARPPGTLIWMHGASVGETSMLLPSFFLPIRSPIMRLNFWAGLL